MKGTIKIKSNDGKKLIVAAVANGVKLTKRTPLGETSLVEVDFRSPSELFEMGRLIDHVTGNELDVVVETAPASPVKVDKSEKKG